MNVLLIGPRATGKTTIARLLAPRLHAPCIDMDDLVLARFAESSVQAVWRVHGEHAWRDAETETLRELLKSGNQVIALGGGVPMIEAARTLITKHQQARDIVVIYLACDANELARRLDASTGDRPSLTGSHPADEVAAVLARREPTYLALADHIVNTSQADPDAAADAIANLLERG
jgi:shikimate kinase